jgi:hypothetical protein
MQVPEDLQSQNSLPCHPVPVPLPTRNCTGVGLKIGTGKESTEHWAGKKEKEP